MTKEVRCTGLRQRVGVEDQVKIKFALQGAAWKVRPHEQWVHEPQFRESRMPFQAVGREESRFGTWYLATILLFHYCKNIDFPQTVVNPSVMQKMLGPLGDAPLLM
jgi:hypothetical protein